jgi:hypothetical protein
MPNRSDHYGQYDRSSELKPGDLQRGLGWLRAERDRDREPPSLPDAPSHPSSGSAVSAPAVRWPSPEAATRAPARATRRGRVDPGRKAA